jgi:NAD(P)-dependent dehydrogenase (short-subunit alcohol dehydrogenase family)
LKVAVVTGGGRLRRRRPGALGSRACRDGGADERSGGRASAFPADVTDAAAVDRAFTEVERALGPIDLLVNNAGVVGPLGPFAESDVGAWWRTLEVNLRGQILCAHRALPGMIARRRGRLINIASGGGTTMLPYFSAYVTSKTALIRFSECLAFEVKPHGIAVFAMGPGTVRTAMSEYSLNSPEGRTWLPWFRDIFDEGRDLPPFWSLLPPARLMSCRDATSTPRTILIVSSRKPGKSTPGASIPYRSSGFKPAWCRKGDLRVSPNCARSQAQISPRAC